MRDAHGRGSAPLGVAIQEEPVVQLREQADIPVGFQVDQILEVVDAGLGGIPFREFALESPYWKDYDAIEGEGPASWADRFDVSNWGLVGAFAAWRCLLGVGDENDQVGRKDARWIARSLSRGDAMQVSVSRS